jgi:hypothetical protein
VQAKSGLGGDVFIQQIVIEHLPCARLSGGNTRGHDPDCGVWSLAAHILGILLFGMRAHCQSLVCLLVL